VIIQAGPLLKFDTLKKMFSLFQKKLTDNTHILVRLHTRKKPKAKLSFLRSEKTMTTNSGKKRKIQKMLNLSVEIPKKKNKSRKCNNFFMKMI
jgi:hypothetical protein